MAQAQQTQTQAQSQDQQQYKADAQAQAQAQAVGHSAYAYSSPPPAPSVAAATASDHRDDNPPSSSTAQEQQSLNSAQHKRVYQACIPCRRRKVRCDLGSVDNPHDPPCVRCRRESKECYFSATRRKRKTDDVGFEDVAEREGDYIIRNGRKRPHVAAVSGSPPPSLDRRFYSDVPLTPGGSMGRTQPLRRPGPGEHTRSDSRSSVSASRGGRAGTTEFGGAGGGEEPNTPLENYEARTVMRKEVYGPHDALDLLYKAAHDTGSQGMEMQTPSAATGGTGSTGASGGTLPCNNDNGMLYAQHAAAQRALPDVHIDPQLTKAGSRAENTPTHAGALKAWMRFRFVRAGWFTAQEAIDYVDYYYKYLSPLTPISPPTFQDPATHLTLLTEEPILAVTLLTIASRYRKLPGTGGLCRANAIHEQLWTYLQGMIERVIWGQEAFGGGFCGSGADESQTSSTAPWRGLRKGSLRTLGTIESLMILTEWHPRALHFPPSEAIDELMVPTYESSLPSDDNIDGGIGGQQHPPAISMGGRRVESWLEPAWRSDRMCWMLLNAAMGLGYELGVFDNIDELLDSGAISRPEYEEEAYRLRADRIKRLILIYLSQLAGRLGWTNMVPENLRKTTSLTRKRPTTATAAGIGLEGTTPGTIFSSLSSSAVAPFNYIPNLELDDAIIHCWAGISNAMHSGNERLFKSRKHTTEIIQTDRYVELLKDFQPMLQDWWIQFERYQLPPYIRHILTIEYEYVRIYVNSLSLQAVVERCATFASGQTQQQGGAAGAGPTNNTSATAAPAASESSSSNSSTNSGNNPGGLNQLSPKTQDIYGKMPIGNIGGVSAADQEYIREVVEGSRNLLRTVVEGLLPDDYLKHAPVRTYFRIISGAMFLLKTFALGATRHDVEVSIRLMDATVEALRTCVVDDVHLGIRFADLLENLTMRLRNRFIYVANPVVNGHSGQGQGQGQMDVSAADSSTDMTSGHHLGQQHGGLLGTPAAHEHGWPRIHAPERAVTPANISATPFDMPSNFAVPTGFGTGGPATPAGGILGLNGLSNIENCNTGNNNQGGQSGNGSNSGHGNNNNNNNNGTSTAAAITDLFGGDGTDWASGGPASDLWFLPAGPAFFQNVAGPGDSGVGMSAEGINVGGMDLLDYMAMDQYPLDGGGGI